MIHRATAIFLGVTAWAAAADGAVERGTPAGEHKAPYTQVEMARAKRDAQNLAAVFSAGQSTGAKLRPGNANEAIQMLKRGFVGGDGFETTTFRVSIKDGEAALASTFLRWDADKGMLIYSPARRPVAPLEQRRIPVQNQRSPLALARAEAINIAIASFVQAEGRAAALGKWAAKKNAEARYDLLAPFLAFAPEDLAQYIPEGYSITLPESIEKLRKVPLLGVGGVAIEY